MSSSVGSEFGRLTVVAIGPTKSKRRLLLCRCVCGAEKLIAVDKLRKGTTKSCGCLRSELQRARTVPGERNLAWRHGKCAHPIYQAWKSMHARCRATRGHCAKYYHASGITVCAQWHNFEQFNTDMSASWSAGLTLERVRVTDGYSPDNCRWATRLDQARNKRNTIYIEVKGQRLSLPEALERYAVVKRDTVRGRLAAGMDPWSALTTPLRSKKKNAHPPD